MDKEYAKKVSDFNQWIKENGVQSMQIEYPAIFTNKDGYNYPGIVAREDIPPYSIIVKVPSHIILNTQTAYNSELNPLFKLYPEVFSPCAAAWEDYTLISYIMYSMAMGDKSKWHYMIDLWPKKEDLNVFYLWSDKEIKETQSIRVIKDNLHENKCLRDSWSNLGIILNKYPQLFPCKYATYDNYLWLWALLASRIFNSYISTTAFTPYAEYVNHENV